jgi:hypothetical protein
MSTSEQVGTQSNFDPQVPAKKRYRKAGIATAVLAVAAAATVGGINKANYHPDAQALAAARANAVTIKSPAHQEVVTDLDRVIESYANKINNLIRANAGRHTTSTQGKLTTVSEIIDVPAADGKISEYTFTATGKAEASVDGGPVTLDPTTVTGLGLESNVVVSTDQGASTQQSSFTVERNLREAGPTGELLVTAADPGGIETDYATDPYLVTATTQLLDKNALVDLSQLAGDIYTGATDNQPPVISQVKD